MTNLYYRKIPPKVIQSVVERDPTLNMTTVVYLDGTSVDYDISGELTSSSIPNKGNAVSVKVGLNVTSIGNQAFNNCKKLTSIKIPFSVLSIGNQAFTSCTSLTKVSLPNVATIGSRTNNVPLTQYSSTFANCTSLESIEIPNVTSLGTQAFMQCKKLTEVTLPSSLTHLYSRAFASNSNLSCVHIPESLEYCETGVFENTPFLSNQPDGLVVFGKVLYMLKGECPSSVEVPSGIKTIAGYAFARLDGLTDISIPDTVTAIGPYAFRSCTGLTEITIPASVESIDEYAFYECRGLTSITFNSFTKAEIQTLANNNYLFGNAFHDDNYELISKSFTVICTDGPMTVHFSADNPATITFTDL